MIISIDYKKLIFQLFCLYSFLVPFEQFLDVMFAIDTKLKPFRIVAILMMGIYLFRSFKQGVLQVNIKEDVFLYVIFIYGIIISLFRIIIAPFGFSLFYNNIFQLTLYLSVYFLFKSHPMSRIKIERILEFLVFGFFINSLYLLFNYYVIGDTTRQVGFMDNPNFLALGLVTAITVLVLKLQVSKKRLYALIYMGGISVLFLAFLITGSRTGFLIMLIGLIYLFFFFSLKRKLITGFLLLIGLTFFLPNVINVAESGASYILFSRLKVPEPEDDPRFAIWKGALKASVESNFVGLGIGQFSARFPEFFKDEKKNHLIVRIVARNYYLSSHSDYIAYLVNYGIFGLLSYLYFLYLVLKRGFWNMKSAISREAKLFNQVLFTILCYLIMFGLTSENFYSPLFWLLLAISTKEETELISN